MGPLPGLDDLSPTRVLCSNKSSSALIRSGQSFRQNAFLQYSNSHAVVGPWQQGSFSQGQTIQMFTMSISRVILQQSQMHAMLRIVHMPLKHTRLPAGLQKGLVKLNLTVLMCLTRASLASFWKQYFSRLRCGFLTIP